jgi:hypothetical protein
VWNGLSGSLAPGLGTNNRGVRDMTTRCETLCYCVSHQQALFLVDAVGAKCGISAVKDDEGVWCVDYNGISGDESDTSYLTGLVMGAKLAYDKLRGQI